MMAAIQTGGTEEDIRANLPVWRQVFVYYKLNHGWNVQGTAASFARDVRYAQNRLIVVGDRPGRLDGQTQAALLRGITADMQSITTPAPTSGVGKWRRY